MEACPPSAGYRFQKFARRNRRVVLTAGLLVGTLLIGLLASGWQALRASRQRDRAVYAEMIAGRRLTAEQAARSDAQTARVAAIDARADAESAANQHRQALVRQYVRQGTEYVDKGDHTTALPWFLKALEIDSNDPNREFIHRMRIAATIERCPKLTSNWKPDRVVEYIEYFADRRRVLLRGLRGPPGIWSLDGRKSDFPRDLGRFATLNSDGTQIVICTETDAVVIADTNTGAVKVKLEEELGRPVFAGFSPKGDRVFVVYGKRRVRVFDTENGEPVTPVLNDCTGSIVGTTFNTSGRYLVASEDQPSGPDSLTVWDLDSPGKVMRVPISKFAGNQGYYLAAGANIVAVPNDVFVAVVSLETGKRLYPHLKHADGVDNCWRFSRNGKLLLTCGAGSRGQNLGYSVWRTRDRLAPARRNNSGSGVLVGRPPSSDCLERWRGLRLECEDRPTDAAKNSASGCSVCRTLYSRWTATANVQRGWKYESLGPGCGKISTFAGQKGRKLGCFRMRFCDRRELAELPVRRSPWASAADVRFEKQINCRPANHAAFKFSIRKAPSRFDVCGDCQLQRSLGAFKNVRRGCRLSAR